MAFTRMIPKTPKELYDSLIMLHENIGHVNSVKVNTSAYSIDIDLDWLANRKVDDIRLVVRRGKLEDANILATRLFSNSKDNGTAPSVGDADALFAMLSPA